jgi:hypothetical protein
MTPRLKAEFWVKAHIRRCFVEGTFAAVVRRGDDTAGTVLVKTNDLAGGCMVLQPAASPDGGRIWMRGTGPAPVSEADADAYIARQLKYDPDLWVLEIEDREGRHFLDEPVV